MENEILMEPTYVQTRTPGNFPSKRESEHEWSEHLDGFSTFNSHTRVIKDHPVEICWDMFEVPFLLVLIGILSAFTSYFVSFIVNYGNTWRWSLVHESDDLYSWALYCVWCLGFALLASFVTQTICKESAGSGLPEMKTILSGVIKPVLLSLRLIVAKLTGLSFALISGLSVGKEGPFVQIAGAIADQLMKLPVFRHVRCQDTKRLEVIACAAASGVCVTFGTAFGAVLFSIEFTSSAYLVKTLPKALLTAACSMIVILWLGITQKLELFDENITSENKLPTMMEIAGFVVIGIISGLLGVLFVTIVEFISSLRNQFLDSTKHSRSVVSLRAYLMVGIVSLLTSTPMYYELSTFPESSGGSRTLLDVLFQKADLKRVYPFLFPYFVYKFIATALSVTLPLPVGLFTPVFLTGGILGRIIGENLNSIAGFGNFFPWEYSLLGAAGLATGVTRAISTAVIVYELAGQSHLRLPLSVVVMTAYFVGNRFSKNVYEALIDTNGTPYMQEIPKSLYNIPVGEVMIPINQSHVLALNSTYRDAHNLLKAVNSAHGTIQLNEKGIDITSNENDLTASYHKDAFRLVESKHLLSVDLPQMDLSNKPHSIRKHYSPSVIPIVKTKKSMVIVGAVLREDLEKSVKRLVKIIHVTKRPPVILGKHSIRQRVVQPISSLYSATSSSIPPSASLHSRHPRHERTEADDHEDEEEDEDDDIIVEDDGVRGSHEELIRLQGHSQFSPRPQTNIPPPYPQTQLTTNASSSSVASNITTSSRQDSLGELQQNRTHPSQNNNKKKPRVGLALDQPSMDTTGDFDYDDHDILDDAFMNERIQFILISHGGRQITPVALSPDSYDHASTWKTLALAVPIDPSPYQIVDSMLLNKVELLFRMLSLNQAYVTNSGRLVGIINRATLREFLGKYAKRPIDKCLLLFNAIFCFWKQRRNGYQEIPDLENSVL